jgi:hypothetical protein
MGNLASYACNVDITVDLTAAIWKKGNVCKIVMGMPLGKIYLRY